MVLKRIGPLSLGKIMGLLYGAMGLIIGFVFAAITAFGFLVGLALEGLSEPLFGLLFGLGAIVGAPIMYGVFGFVGGIITAALYNFIVRFTGGLELEFDGETATSHQG
jgi:hypothetical protein